MATVMTGAETLDDGWRAFSSAEETKHLRQQQQQDSQILTCPKQIFTHFVRLRLHTKLFQREIAHTRYTAMQCVYDNDNFNGQPY